MSSFKLVLKLTIVLSTQFALVAFSAARFQYATCEEKLDRLIEQGAIIASIDEMITTNRVQDLLNSENAIGSTEKMLYSKAFMAAKIAREVISEMPELNTNLRRQDPSATETYARTFYDKVHKRFNRFQCRPSGGDLKTFVDLLSASARSPRPLIADLTQAMNAACLGPSSAYTQAALFAYDKQGHSQVNSSPILHLYVGSMDYGTKIKRFKEGKSSLFVQNLVRDTRNGFYVLKLSEIFNKPRQPNLNSPYARLYSALLQEVDAKINSKINGPSNETDGMNSRPCLMANIREGASSRNYQARWTDMQLKLFEIRGQIESRLDGILEAELSNW
ncbi:MAG: hypothetical protein COT74_00040 [Bdellovibrionales bacterium CG10_big_fil_rev_8_21_14_0_10_45_34]|nr:MAG: hypothetical protein COT74_00040 [Bdellovibrionales bacterium CG10_big_fil_rev_8_21_14_0_10_45_34]